MVIGQIVYHSVALALVVIVSVIIAIAVALAIVMAIWAVIAAIALVRCCLWLSVAASRISNEQPNIVCPQKHQTHINSPRLRRGLLLIWRIIIEPEM